MLANASGTVTSMTPTPLTAVGAGPWVVKPSLNCGFQAILRGSGTVSADVEIEFSLGPSTAPVAIATSGADIALTSDVGLDSDGFITKESPWKWVRLRVTAISGSGASVTGLMGS